MPDEHEPAPSFSVGRKWGVGFNVLLSVGLFLALVVAVNYLAARHFQRFYLAGEASQPLSPQTLGVLKSLTNQVRVVVLFDAEDPLYSSVTGLINEYKHASPKLTIELIDYLRNPGGAQLIKSQYKLNQLQDKDLVLFDCGGRIRVVYQRELSDYDYSGLMVGKTNEVKRSAFKGESLFTGAILTVTDSRQPKAYYLLGHNEHSPVDDRQDEGYAKFIGLLNEKNIATGGISLLGTNELPADCEMLIIAGATDRLTQFELDKVEKYLNQGGRLLVLFNSLVQNIGLERTLANWSVLVGNNIVVEKNRNTTTGQDVIAGKFGNHAIVRPLAGTRGLHFLLPRTVEKIERVGNSADAAKVEELVLASESSVAVTDIRGGVLTESPRDRRGPLALAVAVEKGGLQGVSGDRGATRIVVVGESRFLGNHMIDSGGNRDFANLAVNWLLDRPALLGGVGPRPVKEYKLELTQAQIRLLRWILLLVLPGLVLLFGLLVWFRRRH